MDPEQIERQMRIRRAAIDAKLDLLAARVGTVRRKAMPAVIAGVIMIAALAARAVQRRSARAKRRASSARALRKVG
jgi:hypothetical protein